TASRRTFSFIYGFPNEKSTVIARRAGMSSPAGITRYVRPLRSQKFLARALTRRWQWLQIPLAFVANMLLAMENLYLHLRFARHWSWIEQQDFDAFFDDCWNQSLNSDLLIGERTADSLAWRYP